jgi:hypothetical protein
MRLLFPLFLLVTLILSTCAGGDTPPPSSTALQPPTLSFTNASGSPTHNFTATSQPPQGSLIAYQVGGDQNNLLFLADPAEGTSYQFSLPAEAHFPTPFLAGLSPDARYFVYFTGGWLETLYGVEHLRLDSPKLALKVIDLRSEEIIYSTSLLSPGFPQDLAPIAETIKDEWHFTSQNASFEDVLVATQEMLLDHIRAVAWSPDSSLLAFASQIPGPTTDLYFFSPEDRNARQATSDPAHVLRTSWAPDSASLILVTSLFDRHAREDTTYLLSRDGSVQTSLTSQISFFNRWHDSNHAIFYGGTDAGDNFEPTAMSAADGTTTLLWVGSFADIAFSPDLSSFLLSSDIPNAPLPPGSGLYLGKFGEASLMTLSEGLGWRVAYWGSERFAFAASSIDEGTIGLTPDGERIPIDSGGWRLAPSPDGNYLAGYYEQRSSSLPGLVPGLRLFDGSGRLLESAELVNVTCIAWNADSSTLAYQVENSLYLWEVATGATRLVSDQLNPQGCAFTWVRKVP